MISQLSTIVIMAVASRMSGGGLGAKYLNKKGDQEGRMPFDLTWLPEVLFASGIGVAVFTVFGVWAALAATVWSYIWMQTGHANALPWGDVKDANPNRKNFLTPVVDWLSNKFGWELYGTNYARLFMAIKGFLIGLPIGGLPLMVLWPLGYELAHDNKGFWKFAPIELTELYAGAGAGIAIVVFLEIAKLLGAV